MSKDVLLCMKQVEKSFSGVQVLKKVDFEIKQGEVHALMGENGAGKSTLIKILTGVYPKDGGTFFFNGQEVQINSRQDAKNLGIAVIYQELSLVPTLTVTQNILLGQEDVKAGILNKKSMREKVLALMECYGLSLDPDAVTETLSIAQRQMVEILKALTLDASLIIMDEPTASLSSKEAECLFEIIKTLKEKKVSILYISHRLEEIYRLSDRLTVLRDGENVAVLEKDQINPTEVIRLMIGKELIDDNSHGQMRPFQPEVVLKVENLCRKGAFSNVSFEVHKGEVLGIGGLVGSGRTEILRCIFGADRYDSGTILFNGMPLPSSVLKRIRAGFGLIPEDRRNQGFVPLLNINRNIAITNYDILSKGNMIVNKKDEMAMCRKAIAQLNVKPNNPEINVGNLSGGNQQKVVVGKWMMRNLKVLLIDEPTAGIDVGVKEEIYKLIEDLASKGVVIILVSSDLKELLRVSHRMIVLRHGRIVEELKEGVVFQEDVLKAASGILGGEAVNHE
ncbi:MAG: ABC-type sugar transport system, ATPase component [Bacillota bacterium]|nr:ABC-type sugar transport system, ATPase component [Bacillota bacterium]